MLNKLDLLAEVDVEDLQTESLRLDYARAFDKYVDRVYHVGFGDGLDAGRREWLMEPWWKIVLKALRVI